MEAMSGHVIIQNTQESQGLLARLNTLLREQFGIHHTTLQLEEEGMKHSPDKP